MGSEEMGWGNAMRKRTLGSFTRALTFMLSVLLVAGSLAAPTEARTFDASKIDPVLARQASAEGDREFDVIVRAATVKAARAKEHASARADRARESVRKHGGKTRF